MRNWAIAVTLVAVAAACWWWLKPGSMVIDRVLANVAVGDGIENLPIAQLGIADCWRKQPATGEMVCHYAGARRTYALRFRAANVVEIAHDRSLGGDGVPPFNHRVDLLLAPQR